MAARGYEFYLRVLKVSLTSERSERVRDTFCTLREHSSGASHCEHSTSCTYSEAIQHERVRIRLVIPFPT